MAYIFFVFFLVTFWSNKLQLIRFSGQGQLMAANRGLQPCTVFVSNAILSYSPATNSKFRCFEFVTATAASAVLNCWLCRRSFGEHIDAVCLSSPFKQILLAFDVYLFTAILVLPPWWHGYRVTRRLLSRERSGWMPGCQQSAYGYRALHFNDGHAQNSNESHNERWRCALIVAKTAARVAIAAAGRGNSLWGTIPTDGVC